MSKPEIVVFQLQRESFLFLGVENEIIGAIEEADFVSIWSTFFEVGGFDKIRPFQLENHPPMVIYHKNSGDNLVYFIGSIVGEMSEIPDGYTVHRFPACEFLVITTEWLPTEEDALGEDGLGQCGKYEKNVEIPSGYIRYDGAESQLMLIERENFNTKDGSRYEFWVPIKKIDS